MNKDMLYTNHICHLKASRKLRRPESPGYGERERAKSAELSSGFRLEFGLESSFSQRGKHWSRLQLHDRHDSSTQSLVGLDDARRGRGPEVRNIQKSEGLAVRRIIRAGFISTLGIWKLC